jgi:uncharacterized protein (DUF305 family)
MKPKTKLPRTLTLVSVLGIILLSAATHGSDGQSSTGGDWSELIASMDKMHMAMGAVKPSGDNDVDFVRLMLPHHQAAIDMAKTELLSGKDPRMRRLAQEIITDQQSEIDLMQQWLKARESVRSKENDNPTKDTQKDN